MSDNFDDGDVLDEVVIRGASDEAFHREMAARHGKPEGTHFFGVVGDGWVEYQLPENVGQGGVDGQVFDEHYCVPDEERNKNGKQIDIEDWDSDNKREKIKGEDFDDEEDPDKIEVPGKL